MSEVLDDPIDTYVVERPRISYVQPEDPAFRRWVIDQVERLLGRHRLESVYLGLKSQPFQAQTFFADALASGDIRLQFDGHPLHDVPAEGPLVLIANHPFGVVDGLVMCDLAMRLRGDFRILVHSLLCQDRDLAPYFLPVDFTETRESIKHNIRSKRAAVSALNANVPVVIFPSGGVSTAFSRFGFGPVEELPWRTFVAKLIQDAGATVLPVYFHGRNSRLFQVASHIAEPLRLAMLVREALNKFDNTLRVTVGAPLAFENLEGLSRQETTDMLLTRVLELGRS